MNSIIIFGAAGQLGRCLQDELAKAGADFIALSSADCDITDADSVNTLLSQHNNAIVVNCAAYTAVDKAEDDLENAEKVNTLGPKNIALGCSKNSHQLIHISTDYVFDGSATTPYSTEHETSPIGVYGKTKLAGDQEVLSLLPNSIIIRTSWVFSEYGNNFVKTMLRLAQDRTELNVVADQQGKPSYARDLASGICTVAAQLSTGSTKYGVYHFSNEGETNWCEFAKAIFEKAKILGMLDHDMHVNAITSADYPTRAKRPKYSVLDNTKLYSDFMITPKNWQDSLTEMLESLKAKESL